jgi:hypothetical protein
LGGALNVYDEWRKRSHRFAQAGQRTHAEGRSKAAGAAATARTTSPKPAGPADPSDAYESAKFGSSAGGLMIDHAVWNYASSKRTAQLMR